MKARYVGGSMGDLPGSLFCSKCRTYYPSGYLHSCYHISKEGITTCNQTGKELK